MSYEHNFGGKIVVFPDEENYLKCKLQYLEYKKGFGEDQDYFSFLGYIESFDEGEASWVVEEIRDDVDVQSYTLSIDTANDQWSSISYTNIAAGGSQSLIGADGTIIGFDGTTYYTTLMSNSTNVTDLKNGWTRTDAVYRSSTDTPKEQEKKRKRDEYDRFDILDFD